MAGESKSIEEIVEEERRAPKSEIEEIIEDEIRTMKKEYALTKIQRLVEEEKRRLQELQQTGRGWPVAWQRDFVANIVSAALDNPQKAKEFLKDLTDEEIARFATLVMAASSGNASAFPPMAQLLFARGQSLTAKDVVDIVNAVRPREGQAHQVSPKEFADAVASLAKTIAEARGGRGEGNYQDAFKAALEMLKPMFEEVVKAREEAFDAKLKALEERIVDPLEYLKAIKSAAAELGLSGGGTSPEIEKMRIDLEKWKIEREWEMQKWTMEEERRRMSEKMRWETTRKLLEPVMRRVGPLVESLGKDLAKSVRAAGYGNPAKELAFPCRKCGAAVTVEPGAEAAKCPKCGQEYRRVV